jgi:hypothetical protein
MAVHALGCGRAVDSHTPEIYYEHERTVLANNNRAAIPTSNQPLASTRKKEIACMVYVWHMH